MTIYASDDLDISVAANLNPSPAEYQLLSGLRVREIEITTQAVQARSLADGPWQTVLPDTGRRVLRLSGEGVFTEADGESLLQNRAFSGEAFALRCVFASGATIETIAVISRFTRLHPTGEPQGYRIRLQSAGEVAYSG